MDEPRPHHLNEAISRLLEHYEKEIDTNLLSSFHCALIYAGGRLLSTGFNRQKTNSFVTTFAHHEFVQSIHAEVDAILRVRKKIDLRGTKMYVAKVGRTPVIGDSRPCPMCFEALQLYGIKKVIYTVGSESFASEKVSALGDCDDSDVD